MDNKDKLCTWSDCVGIIVGIIISCLIAVSCAGCGHNTGTFLMGKMAKVGFDSQNAIPTITYVDGFSATDISRENSGWVVDIDSSDGITIGTKGTIKGIRKIQRYVGPQITGNLVELAKTNPDMAKSYTKSVEYFWQYQVQQINSNGKKDPAN